MKTLPSVGVVRSTGTFYYGLKGPTFFGTARREGRVPFAFSPGTYERRLSSVHALVAQLAVQALRKRKVRGSNPREGSKLRCGV